MILIDAQQVYVNLNNLQHVKNALVSVPQTLHVTAIVAAVDGPNMLDVQRLLTPFLINGHVDVIVNLFGVVQEPRVW